MSAQFVTQNDVIRRSHARGQGLHDHLVRTAEARRLQAEAITNGVHWVWTKALRFAARLMKRDPRRGAPAANRNRVPITVGRASVGSAFRHDVERLQRLLRRLILEPYSRRRRRRIAIAQLRSLDDHLLADIGLARGQIELAVDGMLARRDKTCSRPVTGVPAEEARHDLPMAA
jgi:uncharacterized protein YjiS (DUF1127 family)